TIGGLYRDSLTQKPVRIVSDGGGLHFEGGPVLVPLSATRFLTNGNTAEIDAGGTMTLKDTDGLIDRYEHVAAASPTSETLQPLIGRYASAESASDAVVSLDGTTLVVKLGSNSTLHLKPAYDNAFANEQMTAVFERDAAGKPVAMTLTSD